MAGEGDYEHLLGPYPMMRLIQRRLDARYEGPVFVWDIDKTYLDTHFTKLRDLVRIPLELGIDKREIKGTVELLHGLRDGPRGRQHRPLFFVSASPPQIRNALERKMLLDGIEYDGITYKDPLRLILRRQFDQLREQVAFKLAALLLLYRDLPVGAQFYLFGDDAEKDAVAYCLFADVVAGRLRARPLHDTLLVLGAQHGYAQAVTDLAGTLSAREAAREIFIHLISEPDGGSIEDFGAQIVGCPTMAAAARTLLKEGLVADTAVTGVEAVAQPSEPVRGKAAVDAEGFWTPRRYLVL